MILSDKRNTRDIYENITPGEDVLYFTVSIQNTLLCNDSVLEVLVSSFYSVKHTHLHYGYFIIWAFIFQYLLVHF